MKRASPLRQGARPADTYTSCTCVCDAPLGGRHPDSLCSIIMPARVEFRVGNIFDEPCDLLVIPSSARGIVTPEIRVEIRNAGLPLPGAMKRGISHFELQNARWKGVAYAAATTGETSSAVAVENIAKELGRLARWIGYKTIAAPLLGAGSGELLPRVAADALIRGFQAIAPDSTLLVINVRTPDKVIALADRITSEVRRDRTAAWNPGREFTASGPSQRSAAPTAPPSSMEKPPPTESAPAPSRRKGVFISYSHADAEWMGRLQKHLRPLERAGIHVWDDTRLKPGEPWREEIREALAATRIAILLISADFLASDFVVTNELPPLLQAAAEDGATILPVIISPCRFTRMESLSRFQAVNDPERPLVKMRRASSEAVLDQVAQAVEDALKR